MGFFVAKSAFRKVRSGPIQFNKVSDADQAEIDRILSQADQISSQVRQAFLDAVRRMQGNVDVEQLKALLEQGRINEALSLVTPTDVSNDLLPFTDAITAATISAARTSAQLQNNVSGIALSFGQTNPQTVSFLRSYEMTLIREMTTDALSSVRAAIQDGVTAGRNPIDIARDVRQFIGLTQYQTQAVLNYRGYLETGNANALARALRDRRFDPSVSRAVSGDISLSTDQIDRMVARYTESYLKYRSETIARTEARRSLGAGSQQLWNQAVQAGKVDADQVTKKWVTVGDHKVRDAHVELDGEEVGLNEPFDNELGEIMYPGDPDADEGNTINCRCVAIYRFKLKKPNE